MSFVFQMKNNGFNNPKGDSNCGTVHANQSEIIFGIFFFIGQRNIIFMIYWIISTE
jgi:hypothetical protein